MALRKGMARPRDVLHTELHNQGARHASLAVLIRVFDPARQFFQLLGQSLQALVLGLCPILLTLELFDILDELILLPVPDQLGNLCVAIEPAQDLEGVAVDVELEESIAFRLAQTRNGVGLVGLPQDLGLRNTDGGMTLPFFSLALGAAFWPSTTALPSASRASSGRSSSSVSPLRDPLRVSDSNAFSACRARRLSMVSVTKRGIWRTESRVREMYREGFVRRRPFRAV
jgi:hypothetical protein